MTIEAGKGSPRCGNFRCSPCTGRVNTQQGDEGRLTSQRIGTHGLAQRLWIRDRIEQIIRNLEGQPEMVAVVAQRLRGGLLDVDAHDGWAFYSGEDEAFTALVLAALASTATAANNWWIAHSSCMEKGFVSLPGKPPYLEGFYVFIWHVPGL